jgi:membrane fusion protein, macrolide-specific efflux system
MRQCLKMGIWGGMILLLVACGEQAETTALEHRAVTPQRRDLRLVLQTAGVLMPREEVAVESSSAGRLEEWLVEAGALVAAGDVVAWMSTLERADVIDALSESSEAERLYWEELYPATPVLSPVDGVMAGWYVEAKQPVAAGEPLCLIEGVLQAVATLPAEQGSLMEEGQRVTIRLVEHPARPFAGEVELVTLEAGKGESVVSIRVDRLPEFAYKGDIAELTVVVEERKQSMALPIAVLPALLGSGRDKGPQIRRVGMTSLLVKSAGSTVPTQREVLLGLCDGHYIEVVRGLAMDEAVWVSSGLAD